MAAALSPRLRAVVDTLPLEPSMRVLEIGCGPGAAARAVAERVSFVLAIDRSRKAIDAAEAASAEEIASGRLAFRQVAAEDFELLAGEEPFDLAFAVRVGAFDGRHPHAGREAKARLRRAMKPGAALFVDTGSPLTKVALDD